MKKLTHMEAGLVMLILGTVAGFVFPGSAKWILLAFSALATWGQFIQQPIPQDDKKTGQ